MVDDIIRLINGKWFMNHLIKRNKKREYSRFIILLLFVFILVISNAEAAKNLFICEIEASSILDEKYKALNAFDGDLNTCWAEGVDGNGVGESIIFNSSPHDNFNLEEIKIFPGYGKSEKLFYKNSRIKKMEIILYFQPNIKTIRTSKESITVAFKDVPEFKIIPIQKNLVSIIKFKILEVYEGSKWQDTCISEIEVITDRMQLVNKDWEESEFIGKETYTRGHNLHFQKGNRLGGGITKHDMSKQPVIEGTWEIKGNMLNLEYIENYYYMKRGPYKKEYIIKGYIAKDWMLLYGDEFTDYLETLMD